jgi:YHS domain-containing protein
MNLRKIILLTAVVVIGLGLTGCKKKEQPAPSSPTNSKVTASAVTEVEQTTCPVLDGNKIDKNVFVEHKGKKVYFCCAACKSVFEKDPEKYIAKLPQFAK